MVQDVALRDDSAKLDKDTVVVAYELLHRVQHEHRIDSTRLFMIEPGTVIRCDGTGRRDGKRDVSATFVCFPFLTTSPFRRFRPDENKSTSPDIGLLNYLYSNDPSAARDLDQTLFKLSSHIHREIVQVSQVWALILNGGELIILLIPN
jgi:hypothetical protein